MWIGIDDAVKIYARFWRARHGAAGAEAAQEHAQRLQEIGDEDGHHVWSKVAAEIRKQEDAGRLH